MVFKGSPPSSSSQPGERTGTALSTMMAGGLAVILFSGPPISGQRTYHLPKFIRYKNIEYLYRGVVEERVTFGGRYYYTLLYTSCAVV